MNKFIFFLETLYQVSCIKPPYLQQFIVILFNLSGGHQVSASVDSHEKSVHFLKIFFCIEICFKPPPPTFKIGILSKDTANKPILKTVNAAIKCDNLKCRLSHSQEILCSDTPWIVECIIDRNTFHFPLMPKYQHLCI